MSCLDAVQIGEQCLGNIITHGVINLVGAYQHSHNGNSWYILIEACIGTCRNYYLGIERILGNQSISLVCLDRQNTDWILRGNILYCSSWITSSQESCIYIAILQSAGCLREGQILRIQSNNLTGFWIESCNTSNGINLLILEHLNAIGCIIGNIILHYSQINRAIMKHIDISNSSTGTLSAGIHALNIVVENLCHSTANWIIGTSSTTSSNV